MSSTPRAMPVVTRDAEHLDRCVELKLLHDGPLAQVVRWRCLHDGEALRAERHHTTYVLSIVNGGACRILDGAWSTTLDPATAILHRPGSSYRTTHPFGLFDRGWSVAYREDLAEEILERAGSRPRDWKRPSRTVGEALFPLPLREQAILRNGSALERQELAIEFLERIAHRCRDRRSSHRPSTQELHRRIVDRARECLRTRMLEPLDLHQLSREVGASPAHLCRMFKRITGLTIRGYLHRLRLAHALSQIEDGEASLMRVALESGFYSHSHLTATCTRVLGSPPASLRAAN